MKNKIEIMFFVFEIIASEFVVLNCLYQEANNCPRHSVCKETVLGFCIIVTESFRKTITFAVINKYGKRPVLHVPRKFRRIYHVDLRLILSNGTF